jgi:hypothetical protein
MSIARQRRSKHVSAATNKLVTIAEPLEVVSSARSVSSLNSEIHREKLVSRECELVADGSRLWLRLGGSGRQGCEHGSGGVSIVGSRSQATHSEDYNKLRSLMCVIEIC